MVEWSKICFILDQAVKDGKDAVIPKDLVQEFYIAVHRLAAQARHRACKKVFRHIQKIGEGSFWLSFAPGQSCITVHLHTGFKNRSIQKLYRYLNKYYQYTESDNNITGNLKLCLNVDGSQVWVDFANESMCEDEPSYKDMVRAWSESSSVARAIKTNSDTVMWGLFCELTGDSQPFLVSLEEMLL